MSDNLDERYQRTARIIKASADKIYDVQMEAFRAGFIAGVESIRLAILDQESEIRNDPNPVDGILEMLPTADDLKDLKLP